MVAPDPDQQTDPRADNHRCRIAFCPPQQGIANADTKATVEQAKSSPLRGGDSKDQPLLRTPRARAEPQTRAVKSNDPGTRITERIPRKLGTGWVFRDSNRNTQAKGRAGSRPIPADCRPSTGRATTPVARKSQNLSCRFRAKIGRVSPHAVASVFLAGK